MSPRPRILLASLTLVASVLACHEDKAVNPAPTHELDSPSLLGATTGSANYIHTFENLGTYAYHCLYHSTAHHRMGGTVIVDASGADSAFVTIFQSAYAPDVVTIKPHAQVRWQNFDEGTHHTVTSD